jgi:hypothetical protein
MVKVRAEVTYPSRGTLEMLVIRARALQPLLRAGAEAHPRAIVEIQSTIMEAGRVALGRSCPDPTL